MLAALFAVLAIAARPASASSPYLFTPTDEVREASPTFRYANMTNEEAYAELDRRGVPYYRMENVDGVRAPIRLDGPLHGVDVHSSLPPAQRVDTIFEILDARLALSLDDFCELLARHDIVELVHYTMYRPNGPKPETEHHAVSSRSSGKRSSAKRSLGKGSKSSKSRTAKRGSGRKQKAGGTKPRSKGKPASKKTSPANKKSAKRSDSRKASSKPARRSSRRSASSSKGRKGRRVEKRNEVVKSTYAPPGTRHPAGLAIDVGGLRKRDGRWLSVAHHFNGHLGARTCGPTSNPPKSAEGRELWSIVCEAADLGLFTYVLTPNFDKWHADHLHMEIRGDVRWFLYH